MSLGNTAETNLLKLIFQNVDMPNIGDATGLRGSSVPGVFYLSLHTADPGEAGDQSTNEISYTGYARISVVRSAVGFTVAGSNVSNAAELAWGACTAGSGTATWVAVGSDVSGAGNKLARAEVSTPGAGLAISAGITPKIAIGNLDFNVD